MFPFLEFISPGEFGDRHRVRRPNLSPMLLRKIGDSIIPAVGFGTGGVGVAGYGSLRPFEDRLKVRLIPC